MNRCTQLDDILHQHVHWQSHEPIEFQGHRPKVKVIFSLVDQSSPNCFHRTWKKIVVDNAVFRLSIALSVPEIFAIEVYRGIRNLVHCW